MMYFLRELWLDEFSEIMSTNIFLYQHITTLRASTVGEIYSTCICEKGVCEGYEIGIANRI